MRLLLTALATLSLAACYREISSEERLDRETNTKPVGATPAAEELKKINCADVAEPLAKARDVNKNETERVADYTELYGKLKGNQDTFELAMARNPDLAYMDGSAQLVAARDTCIQQTADVRVEFESYVRELVNVPTVQEYKGGKSVTVARLDFDTLRDAIEVLNPDDKETLVVKVNTAESKLEASEKKPPRTKKPKK
jgi:hypothetical protein